MSEKPTRLLKYKETDIANPAIVDVLCQIDMHSVSTNDKLDSLELKIDCIGKAFPGGDYDGHRRYHETMIEILAEKRKLRAAITEKTIGGLIWSGMIFMGLAVWHYVLRKAGIQ